MWLFIAFWMFSIFHLYTCFKEYTTIRMITKVFIVPMLIVIVLVNKAYNTFLIPGLILGWIGDIFLLYPEKKKCFILGTLSFGIGHLFYILATISEYVKFSQIVDIPLFIFIICGLITICLLLISFIKIRKVIGMIAILGACYFSLLVSVIVITFFAKQYLLSLAFLIFIASDIILSIDSFYKPIKRNHFYIMLTYISAQFLVVLCFMTH